MKLKLITKAFFILFATGLYAGLANASFHIVDHSANINVLDKNVSFSIAFSESPDFFTLDSSGRQAHSFQYRIVNDIEEPYYGQGNDLVDRLIRGSEIHVEGSLRVREGSGSGSDPDPNSGGWGSIVGSVVYALDDKMLSFTIPWYMLGEDDGKFSYALNVTEFGGGNAPTVFGVSSVPLPPAYLLLGGGLLGLFGFHQKRRV